MTEAVCETSPGGRSGGASRRPAHRAPRRDPHGPHGHSAKTGPRGPRAGKHHRGGGLLAPVMAHRARIRAREARPSTTRGPGRLMRSESTRKTRRCATASIAEKPGRLPTASGTRRIRTPPGRVGAVGHELVDRPFRIVGLGSGGHRIAPGEIEQVEDEGVRPNGGQRRVVDLEEARWTVGGALASIALPARPCRHDRRRLVPWPR